MTPERSVILQDILEHLPIAIVVADMNTGAILWANTRAMRLAGATRAQQIVAHNLLEYMDPAQHGIALRDLEAVARGESPEPVIYRLKRLSGGQADVQISSVPVRFRGERAMLSVVADVTETQRAVRALSESEERYRELVEMAPSGVVVVRANGDIVYANPALAGLLGVDEPAQLLDRSFYSFVDPGHRKEVRAARKLVLSTCEAHPAAPITLLRHDGSTLEATAQTACVRWEGDLATQTLIRRNA